MNIFTYSYVVHNAYCVESFTTRYALRTTHDASNQKGKVNHG
jgi:hypothetical protein